MEVSEPWGWMAGFGPQPSEGEISELDCSTAYPLTFSAEASRDCVKTSQSLADAPASSTGSGPACSSSSPVSLTLWSDPEGGSSLRTFPDFFHPTAAEISPSFSRRWPSSGFVTSPGECWTADTSECPSGGDGCSSLADVLVADVPARFFLSPRAAAGILRRAEKRGRELPAALRTALQQLSTSEVETAVQCPNRGKSTSERRPAEVAAPTFLSENQRAEVLETDYARQLTTGGEKPGQGYPAMRHGQMVRRLTPTECERLQALPDGWTIPHGPSLAPSHDATARASTQPPTTGRWCSEEDEAA